MLCGMRDVKGTTDVRPSTASSLNAHFVDRTRRPKREVVRRRLLDAALEVFAERGFDTSNLDQVAAAAGLSKGAIYSNFTSKDDLFYTMMTEQVLVRVESVRNALAARPTDVHQPQDFRDVGGLLTEAFTEQREWR